LGRSAAFTLPDRTSPGPPERQVPLLAQNPLFPRKLSPLAHKKRKRISLSPRHLQSHAEKPSLRVAQIQFSPLLLVEGRCSLWIGCVCSPAAQSRQQLNYVANDNRSNARCHAPTLHAPRPPSPARPEPIRTQPNPKNLFSHAQTRSISVKNGKIHAPMFSRSHAPTPWAAPTYLHLSRPIYTYSRIKCHPSNRSSSVKKR
jgi:hypothetical protein